MGSWRNKKKIKEEYREAVIRHLSSFGIEVKTGIEIEGFCVGIEKAELKDTQQYMVVQTQAYDVFSAAHFSIIGLSEVLNTLSFFTAIESWSVSDISLIVYNTRFYKSELHISLQLIEGFWITIEYPL